MNICIHLAGTGTGRHVIMMHYGNGDIENGFINQLIHQPILVLCIVNTAKFSPSMSLKMSEYRLKEATIGGRLEMEDYSIITQCNAPKMHILKYYTTQHYYSSKCGVDKNSFHWQDFSPDNSLAFPSQLSHTVTFLDSYTGSLAANWLGIRLPIERS